MFPSSTIIANSLVQSLHDPNQLPDGSVEKPLLPLVPWHPFGPPALLVEKSNQRRFLQLFV
jgi:hypothetical protein